MSVKIGEKDYPIDTTTVLELDEDDDYEMLPENIGDLKNLEEIIISSGYSIQVIPDSIGSLIKLRILSIERGKYTTLPDSIGLLQNLEHIDLGYNHLTSLPESIGNLTNLLSMQFKNTKLTTLPDSIGRLEKLQDLHLYMNNFTSLPDSIGNLQNLRSISFNNNQLTSLPESIGNLQNLKRITLYNNKFTSLPESIGRLENLEDIVLYNNKLTSLPESIGRLVKMEGTLNLNDNQLTTLPDSIGSLVNLTILRIYKNKLITIPDTIGNIEALKELHIGDNNLTTLPESIGNLQKLHALYLNDNQLTSLPDSIGNLQKLHTLDLNDNQLTSLPDSIGGLQELKILDLYNNQLTSLPDTIGDLKELNTLNLDNNKLNIFPAIGNLTKLEKVFLRNNQLTTIIKLPNLATTIREFRTANNPFTDPEFIGKNEQEIFDMLFVEEFIAHDRIIMERFIGPDFTFEIDAPYHIQMSQDFVKQTQYRPLDIQNSPELKLLLSLEPKPHVVYACPDGHLHTVGDCGIPIEITRCDTNGCKLYVGGLRHMLVPGSYIVYHDKYYQSIVWYGSFPVQSYSVYKRLVEQANKARSEMDPPEPEIILQSRPPEEIGMIARPLEGDDVLPDMYLHGHVECKICYEDIILGEDNLYILPSCGHLVHKNDLENYRQGDLNNIFEYQDGNVIEDSNMAMRKCPECTKQFAFGNSKNKSKSRSKSKKCDKAYTNRLLSIFDFIQNNSELSAFNNLVVNYCLFAYKINFKDGLMSVNIVKNSLENFYKYINIIPKDLLVNNCSLYKGIDLPPFDVGSRFFLPLPLSTAQDKSIVKQFARPIDNIITILKINIDENIKYFPTTNFTQGYEILLPPGHITVTKIDIKDNIKLTTVKYRQISNLEDLKREYKKRIDKGLLHITETAISDC